MTWWLLVAAPAAAEPVAGEPRTDGFGELWFELAAQGGNVLLALEADVPAGALSCTVCLPKAPFGVPPMDVAYALLQAPCAPPGVFAVSDPPYAYLVQALPPGGPLPVLDRTVAVPAGRYTLEDFGSRLEAAFDATRGPQEKPIGVTKNLSYGRSYDTFVVPSGLSMPARELLRSVRVEPMRPEPGHDERLVWRVWNLPTITRVTFWTADRTVRPPSDYVRAAPDPDIPPSTKLARKSYQGAIDEELRRQTACVVPTPGSRPVR